jgi:uncharacterized protein
LPLINLFPTFSVVLKTMGFRLSILVVLVLFNTLPIYALIQSVRTWVAPRRRRVVMWCALAAVAVINVPISIFWFRQLYDHLYELPAHVLRASFVPTLAWQSSALFFTLVFGPIYVIAAVWLLLRSAVARASDVPPETTVATNADSGAASRESSRNARLISRRALLTGGPGLLVPAMTLGLTGKVFLDDDVDVSPEIEIPVPNLPRSLDGIRIVQLSDLHAGPYIRRKEIEYWATLTNSLNPDLVVLTGDMIDRSMDSLPELLAGLQKLRPSLGSATSGGSRAGVVAVLGNHDLSSDPRNSRGDLLGGENIAQAMRALGIRTLRNEVIHIGGNGFLDRADGRSDALAIMGMDWVRRRDGGNFFAYHSQETRERLAELSALVEPGIPSILLAHHPDTFSEVREMYSRFPIALTLSGHTHGGGQVVFFQWNGRSYGLTSMQFQYVSGLFQQDGCSLYVNRGLGYFGVPIRINCPPEISRFKLIRSA